jgi:preprotein translocase subunit SecD
MDRRYINLIVILLILAAVIWVDLPSNPGISIGSFQRTLKPVLGLDLRGGLQVLLKPPAGVTADAQSLEDASSILENRANGLGVSEVVFQVAGNQYILGEFPGLTNTDEVIKVLKQTGSLEFVDLGDTYLQPGTEVKTDGGVSATTAATPTEVPTTEATPAATETPSADKIWHTVMTGAELQTVSVTPAQLSGFAVNFELTPEGAVIFKDYSSANIGKYLAIVLDGKVVSAPQIQNAITDGKGEITGNFTSETANNLAVTLRYGRLPVSLDVVESRLVGPTLGEDSLNKSLLAGAIGFAIVFLFMAIYYKLPGIVAVFAIIFYGLLTFALFKLIPVTLTLPGIAGFLLSTGSALDANILIFERLKEELRNGRNLRQAIELGWKRAWPSIRDSNIATIITSLILFWFGSTYGATIVKGFALTLALGVFVSLFNAIFVTRTFLAVVIDWFKIVDHKKWFGA